MWAVSDKETGLIIRYDFNYIYSVDSISGYEVELVGSPCDEWRE